MLSDNSYASSRTEPVLESLIIVVWVVKERVACGRGGSTRGVQVLHGRAVRTLSASQKELFSGRYFESLSGGDSEGQTT